MKRKSLKTIYARREFCSPDVLLRYILGQIESSPAATFAESELVHISKSSFQALKQQCLKYIQRDPEKEVYFDKEGNERAVRKINGKWIAASTDDSEIAPIQLTEKDLMRYSFNIQPLLAEIKARNNLIKNVDQITPRVHFVGEKMVLGNSVGVFVALLGDDAQAEAELLGLRSKIDTFDNILVLCPSFVISSQALLNRLAGQNIVCLPFGKKNYTIEFSKARFKREIEQGVPRLTAEQHADYSNHGYKCFDKVDIPGTKP